jgi:RNA polymerase sigma-70 factor (ECF subfamily)
MSEIADVQGLELSAAKQRLRRGRMMLVTALAGGAERRARLRGVPLRCRDARRRVSDYLDGDLPAEERTLLERHLETSPTCPPLYASLVGVQERLGDLRDPDTVVPPGLAKRIHARLESGRERHFG